MSTDGRRTIQAFVTGGCLLVGAAVAIAVVSCTDETTGLAESAEELTLTPGVNVFLTVDDDAAAPGSRVVVTGRVTVVEADLTPTAYLIDIGFDPAKLTPMRALKLDDGVLRVINLAAGAGLLKAAGAAPDGLKSDVLFTIEMGVLARDYIGGLEVEVRELTVLERGFADIALDVILPPGVVKRN